MGSRYLSKAAVLWVLYEAPDVPARLLSTLIVLAAYASSDGTSTYPAVSTVAKLTRKSERQVKRDIAELVELKLLKPGNQRLTANIRPDRRPVVYDLAMPADNTPRGDTHDTPYQANGVTPMTRRGDIQGQNGVSPMTPEEVLKTSGRARSRDRADGADADAPPEDAEPRITCFWCGGTDHDTVICLRKRDAAQQQQAQDAPPMAESIARLREALRKNGPEIMNSAGMPRWSEIIAPGIGLVVGTADDMRAMAILLALDAELTAAGLNLGDDGNDGE